MSRYQDIRTNLDVHPINGDLVILEDNAAIENQIRNLIFTNHYEKPWDPELGSGVPRTLFESYGNDFEFLLKKTVTETITGRVSRATLNDVQIKYDGHYGYNLTIVYTPKNTLQPETLKLFLKRTR